MISFLLVVAQKNRLKKKPAGLFPGRRVLVILL